MYKRKLKGNNNSVPEKYSPIANEDKFFIKAKNPPIPWGVTPRRVNYYCAGGRILGAVKMAGVWLLPKTAEKPMDACTKDFRKIDK